MSITTYIGIPGSGKSYEVVANVIIPACLIGRRIVTNIYGISKEKIHQYCVNEKKAELLSLGNIVVVTNEEVMDENFFPFKTELGVVNNSFCKAGDLICVDEAWRIWNEKIHDNHKSFLAEHRHFVNDETGISCDLVVINQAIANLPRFIKERIDMTYRMQKLSMLGLSTRYRVDVFIGAKIFKVNLLNSYYCSYNSEIFGLYASYEVSKVGGRELIVDARKNIFASKRVLFLIMLLPLLFGFSVWYLYEFFSGNSSSITKDSEVAMQAKAITPEVNYSSFAKPMKKNISNKWKIVGKLKKQDDVELVILADLNDRLRFEPASNFSFNGLLMTGEVDGEIVNQWSGK